MAYSMPSSKTSDAGTKSAYKAWTSKVGFILKVCCEELCGFVHFCLTCLAIQGCETDQVEGWVQVPSQRCSEKV